MMRAISTTSMVAPDETASVAGESMTFSPYLSPSPPPCPSTAGRSPPAPAAAAPRPGGRTRAPAAPGCLPHRRPPAHPPSRRPAPRSGPAGRSCRWPVRPAWPRDHDVVFQDRGTGNAGLRQRSRSRGQGARCARSAPDCRGASRRRSRVSCSEPRSIVVLAPISTSSSSTTRPSCGTLRNPSPAGTKPKPSWPMRAPG